MKERGSWFRFYDGALDNAKVQRLPDPIFRAWVNVLCLASRKGGSFSDDDDDVAFALRTTAEAARRTLGELLKANLVEIVDHKVTPHDWNLHQYVSDISTPRVKRFRKRKVKRFTKRNGTVSETPPEQSRTDSDSEQKQTQRKKKPGSRKRARHGTRWPSDAIVVEDWITRGYAAREAANLPRIDLELEAKKFALFWAAKAGKSATKIDWFKTWINWVLDESKQQRRGKSAGGSNVFGELAHAFRETENKDR